ncbi:MAG: PQQ-dependent sugar dehydrogenase, partial [Candidatus Hodarchaeales archaeon]
MVNNRSFILTIGLLGTIIISGVYFTVFNSNNLISNNTEIYDLTQIFPDLGFSSIVGVYSTDSYPDSLFIVEQSGRIQLVKDFDTIIPNKTTFLDIQSKVLSGGELGLLGLAFDPNFSTNGFFYVNYNINSPRRTHISRFSSYTVDDVLIADSSSELLLLEVRQPYSNHNAGDLTFGLDNYLYIPLGDGGSGGDPLNNGQNRSTLLGSILRIDVSQSNNSHPYRIPSDNPFFNNGNGYREEIYAYGLRNPWRVSVDSETGDIWVGDVGQNTREEINIVEIGKNFGWNIMEGDICYNSATCNMNGLEPPIWDYDRSEGSTVTGGYVYHGKDL